MKFLIIFLLVFPLSCFPQDFRSVENEKDTLFIKLLDTTIGEQVLIDKINYYGDSLDYQQKGTISFLFTTKNLMRKLMNHKEIMDSLKKKKIIQGGPRPRFGMLLSYYNMDFKTVREKVKYFNEHVDPIEELLGKNNNLTEAEINGFRQKLYESLGMPLTSSFFAKKEYFEGKEIFVYKGTTQSLQKLRDKIKYASKIFILLPLCGPMEFDYHVLQVI